MMRHLASSMVESDTGGPPIVQAHCRVAYGSANTAAADGADSIKYAQSRNSKQCVRSAAKKKLLPVAGSGHRVAILQRCGLADAT